MLHDQYTEPGLCSIYGAGCTSAPRLMLMFMNPTARNIAAVPSWQGLRAPWIGTRQTWKLLSNIGLVSGEIANTVITLRPEEWDEDIARDLYEHIAENGLYITNLAKCTQSDARHLPDSVFREYLPATYAEIAQVRPQKIIAFGNQVSSILLKKPISVSHYAGKEFEELDIGEAQFSVFPSYYPVGQGQRNLPKAIRRIRQVLSC